MRCNLSLIKVLVLIARVRSRAMNCHLAIFEQVKTTGAGSDCFQGNIELLRNVLQTSQWCDTLGTVPPARRFKI